MPSRDRNPHGARLRPHRHPQLGLPEGAILVGVGIALGILGTLVLTRFVAALLFGVTPTDAATLAAVAFALGLVASLACYLPARRATRLDPMSVLRAE